MDQESREEDDPRSPSWIESITTMLAAVDDKFVQACSISIVADQLKKSNEDAYMPKVVSIGPLYRGTKRDLLFMEEIKLRCMLSLFHRVQDVKKSLKECCEAILRLDKVVRASYVNDIKLDSYELARIMLLDGCFLLELLITGSQEELKDIIPKSRLEPPGPGADIGKMEEVLSDLTMLENQIPIFILHKLSTLLFPHVFTDNENGWIGKINDLAFSLLGYSPVSNPEASHLLELVHSSISVKGENLEQSRDQSRYLSKSESSVDCVVEIQENQHSSFVVKIEESTRRNVKLKRCATRLHAAGVTIKPPDSELAGDSNRVLSQLISSLGNIRVRMLRRLVNVKPYQHVNNNPAVCRLNADIRFSNGKLEIPQLHITKTTEANWRNLIAWEHHIKHWKTSSAGKYEYTEGFSSKFTSLTLLFNGLICCADDVQLLKDRKVIVDHLNKTNQDLLTFFSTINMGIDHSIIDSSYFQMCGDLNKYSAANYATEIPITTWHYFRKMTKFLKRDYNFAAAVILLLTIVQTCYTVLSYHSHK